ncbi:MAG TPA: hemerythrin domain-containing protein [Polyangia bacterium]|nr:hemerythrin domain-containing protein [Polyangia bacterium]
MSRAAERRRRWQPPRFVDEEIDEGRVRAALFAQHERLRVMLTRLEAKALELIRSGTGAAPELAAELAGVATAFEDHTRGEERALTRLLPRTAAASRALAVLREDHRCQREELGAMSRLAARCDDAITLALAVRGFVSDLRLDMDAEDRRLLSPRPLDGEPADAEG